MSRRSKEVLRIKAFRNSLITLVLSLVWNQSGHARSILGTGSAFAQPIYTKWGEEAKLTTGVQLNYQLTGSAAGQNQVLSGLTDFGATDVPMEDAKLKQSGILQFPTIVGGVAFFVNLPNIRLDQIRLTGAVLADIFMGSIERWDDIRIARLNPGLALPNLPIAPLHHAAASGTTYAVSRFLAKVSIPWRDKMGVGMSLNWLTGAGVRGGYGAASTVPTLPGSIGYAEISYVTANHLATVQLKNKAGRFVAANAGSFAAAEKNADWRGVPNFAVDLTDMPGERSWPVVTATFVLVPTTSAKAMTSDAVLTFFAWAFAHGDDAARSLQYVPLPEAVKADIENNWRQK